MYLGFWCDVSMPIRLIPTNSIRAILVYWLKCTCRCQSRVSEAQRFHLLEALDTLPHDFDFLLVDTGAGISADVIYHDLEGYWLDFGRLKKILL